MKRTLLLSIVMTLTLVVTAQHVTRTMTWDGTERQYLEYVPASYTGETPVPVIFCLHGLGDDMNNFSGVGFDYLPGNWIMITPQALVASLSGYTIGTAWNSGAGAELPFFGYTVLNADVDDEGYLLAILDSLENNFNINTDSVFFMGFSMGGFMSHKMAIRHGDRITAIASVNGTIGSDVTDEPITNVNVLHFHGTADQTIAYEDAAFNTGGMGTYTVGLGAEQTVEFWRAYNNCAIDPVVTYFPNTREDGKTFERYLYQDGDNNSYTAFIKIIGGDHEWYYEPQNDIDYTTEIYKFFTNTMDFPSGNNLTAAKPEISVFPNPATDVIAVNLDKATSLSLFDITGKCVLSQNFGAGLQYLNIAELPAGIYMLQCDGESVSTKISVVR